jgi:DnaK suppressor protein
VRYQTRTANQAHPATAAGLASQLAQQEVDLLARRHTLKDEIARMGRDGRDSAEYSADQTTFGVNAALLAATARTMRGIEDALQRLRSETYGRCLDCSEAIAPARLEALPFAERCLRCQERVDEEARAAAEVFRKPIQ